MAPARGATKRQPREHGVVYAVTFHNRAERDRAIVHNTREGLFRVLRAHGKDGINGVTIAASRAGEMLARMALAMQYDLGLQLLLGAVHAYPDTEALAEAGGQWRRGSRAGTRAGSATLDVGRPVVR